MADVNTAEMEAKVEASFISAGSDGIPPVEAVRVVDVPVVADAEPTPVPADPAPAPAPAPVPEKPRYAKIRTDEFDRLKEDAGQVRFLQREVARLANTVGNTAQLEQRIVEKLQSQTPAGLAVEFSDEDFAELAEAVPEIAKLTRTSLERIFKKAGVRGTGTASTPQLRDEDVDKGVERALQRREAAQLVKAYPDWSTIVGQVDVAKGQKPDEANEFRRWLAAQPEAYQKEVNETDSPAEVRSAIDKFMSSKTAPAPSAAPTRAAARRAVMEDAVTPRTDGSPPMMSRPMTAEEAFASVKPIRPH